MRVRSKLFQHISKKKLLLAFGDVLLIVGGLAGTSALSNSGNYFLGLPFFQETLLVSATFLFLFYLANLYCPLAPPHQRRATLARILFAVAGAAGSTWMLSVIFSGMDLAGGRLAVLSLFMVPGAYLWRWAFERIFYGLMRPVRVLVVGAGWAGTTIGLVLAPLREFRVLGYIDDDENKRMERKDSAPVLGNTSDMLKVVGRYTPDLIVLAITHEKRGEFFRHLLEYKMQGIAVYDMPSLYEELTGRIPVKHIRDSWFVYSSFRGIGRPAYAIKLKRLLDIALSFFGIALSLPFMVLTIAAIALESGFPVLYKQKRVGQNEREFWLLKFRSMQNGAEDGTGAVWAKSKDDRVTKVGQIIRLLRIDEIPQMWNVLKDDMSFIGPRPERPEFVKEFKDTIPYYSLRHTIKPGITGWAQVNYPYGASEEDALEKLQYDLYYLKNISMLLDLHILLRTVRVVLFRQGSR